VTKSQAQLKPRKISREEYVSDMRMGRLAGNGDVSLK
jgi:hypothetical protein